MADDLGSDFHCVDDVDENLSVVTGRTCLGEACARRLGTQKLGLWYDRDYGYDVRDFMKRPVSTATISRKANNECAKDERVEDVASDATFVPWGDAETDETPESLTIQIRLTDDAGPFEFTVAVDLLTTSLLWDDF